MSDHMSSAEFRRHGHALVDWIADYHQRVESLPVLSRAAPGELRARLPAEAPHRGEPFEAMLADVESLILPGLTHWQSPNFFAYFPANTSGPSILGELLAAGLGVQGMLWTTSPACTELETHVLDWLADMLDLPAQFRSDGSGGGVIQDSASSATLCALLAARERARADGVDPASVTVYASSQAHSSVEKAVRIAGLGADALRPVEVDAGHAMDPQALAQRLREDRAAGRQPLFAVATLGTTSSTAFDPLAAIAPLCREQGLWLHVDAALAGSAAICPEFRHWQAGLEQADSYCFNPHKWLFTNFDCDCFYVADREPLLRALSVMPEYLRNRASDSGTVIDYRDWQIPLGRRFRALKLWFVIRHYGIEGLQRLIRQHVALARGFADRVVADPDFELAAPVPLNLVCFRHRGGDAFNQTLLERLNASGRLYLTHTRLDGRYTLRLCVGQTHTEARHVDAAWDRIRGLARELAGGS
ncbi:MAG: pyridoxal-dependent decarboxylase [Candidatus Competibacterales bacterium]|nr:pyridoxal-dependent decarboxylase [Candidatus Competibacterales bacterium]